MTPDFFTVEWSPTRGAAIVRDTNGGEYPYDECDEAAHQLLACGNLARRMNTPPEPRPATDNPGRVRAQVTVTDTNPTVTCVACGDPESEHSRDEHPFTPFDPDDELQP